MNKSADDPETILWRRIDAWVKPLHRPQIRLMVAALLKTEIAKRDAEWREAAKKECDYSPAECIQRDRSVSDYPCPACRTVARMSK